MATKNPNSTMARKDAPVTVTCYGNTKTWVSRERALEFYKEACRHSEGAERNRYLNIVWGIEDGLSRVSDE